MYRRITEIWPKLLRNQKNEKDDGDDNGSVDED